MRVHDQGIFIGSSQETGIWFSPKPRWRVLWQGHDSLFIAAWRLRLRVMKP